MKIIQEQEQGEHTQDIVVVNGRYIDAETGEDIGPAEGFAVTDEGSANWVLQKITEAEASIAKEQMTLKAISERINANIKRHEKRAAWLRQRFEQELQSFAAQELDGKKSRSLNLAYGTLAFRTTPGRLRVVDEEKALAWAKAHCPAAVKTTETVLVSKVENVDAIQGDTGLGYVEPSEVFTIKTGVKP